MMELIPAILASTEDEARSQLNLLGTGVPWFHIDIMDGTLIPEWSWADPNVFAAWKIPSFLELHLMVNDPMTVMDPWMELSSVRRVIWHIESESDHFNLIRACHAQKRQTGLAICIETPLRALIPYAQKIDEILCMGVPIGHSGQHLTTRAIHRASMIHEQFVDTRIGFDGGVREEHLSSLAASGVSRVCAHSLFFHHSSPSKQFKRLQDDRILFTI